MKQLILITTTFLLLSFTGGKLTLVSQLATNTPIIYTDHIDNVYIKTNHEINKYNSKGVFKFKFTNKNIGTLSFLDTSNPLKLFLFYKDLGQIMYLDNMLSETSEILNFFDLGLTQVTLACNSYNNGFWVFDQNEFEIIRFNQQRQQEHKSNNLSQLIENAIPNYILEYDNKVYLNIPESGIYVFDLFGSYISKIEIKDLKKFQITNNKIYFTSDNNYQYYDLLTKEINEIKIPETNFTDVKISPNLLVVSNSKAVKFYSTK